MAVASDSQERVYIHMMAPLHNIDDMHVKC